jgi:hypothetical protein
MAKKLLDIFYVHPRLFQLQPHLLAVYYAFVKSLSGFLPFSA